MADSAATASAEAPTAASTPAPEEEVQLTPWQAASFTATHAATALLLKVLSLSGLYRFGQMFGTVEWLINFKRRRRFAQALTRILGRKPTGAERRRETRSYFVRSRCDKLFYLILDCVPRDTAIGLLTIGNKDLLDAPLARGGGVYLAMSHHGAQHVVALLMALNGYKTAAVRDRKEGGIRRYVQSRFDKRYPEFERTRWLFADSYPREIFRCLRDGFVLGSAMDVSRVRSDHLKTEDVTIFGEPRRFLSGPLRVARRCRVPVLQTIVASEPGFRYRLDLVDTLLDPDNAGTEDEAVRTAMRKYVDNLERAVRAAPSLISRIGLPGCERVRSRRRVVPGASSVKP